MKGEKIEIYIWKKKNCLKFFLHGFLVKAYHEPRSSRQHASRYSAVAA